MKTIIGLTTRVLLFGKKRKKEVIGRVDTGATKSSIDDKLAEEIGVGPELKKALIKSASGTRRRSVVLVELMIGGKPIQAEFTLADRTHLKYPMLIGQNILKKGFLIDPSKVEK